MLSNKLILPILVLFCLSCSEGIIVDHGQKPTFGKVTLTTIYKDGKTTGFSFSEANIVKYPNSQGIIPDITVNVQTNEYGDPIGTFLTPVNLEPTFLLKYWPSTMDSAMAYYDTLSFISDTSFSDLAIPVLENQVWAVNTHDWKFAKILITSSFAFTDSSNINNITLYGEITFKWKYQPDGSWHF